MFSNSAEFEYLAPAKKMNIYTPMKKMITLKNIAYAMFLALPLAVNAQNSPKIFGKSITEVPNADTGLVRCISAEYEKFLQEKNPNRATTEQFEAWIDTKTAERKAKNKGGQKSGNTILKIPVVVHVIHDGDAVGVSENIKDAQVISQITVLNQDYRRMSDTPGFNDDEVGADIEIEFCLAMVDPTGQPTNGIDRQNLEQAEWDRNGVEYTIKEQTQWDPTKYLNIWVCRFGGDLDDVLGYAQFPENSGLQGISDSGFDFTDGVAIGYQYFGSKDVFSGGTYLAPYNKGRTTTHEVGHYLGLRHIWGDGNGCNNTDYCNDTPYASAANYGCQFGIDSCPNKLGADMINNYMDYSDDVCMNIFTQNQKERILTVLENADRRASLTTSNVCGLTATTAEFQTLQQTTIYPNPAQNELNISVADGDLPDSYIIYNTLGQVVANAKISGEASLTVNTSGYANGIYIIKIVKGNEAKTLKFIKN
jgi:hypothetical protein